MAERKRREKLNIIYDTVFHGKRLVVATDPHNWIVIRGSTKLDDEVFLQGGARWFFSSLPKMLLSLQKYFVKERIKRLETSAMIRVIEQSYEDVEKLGQSLMIEIVAKDCYSALPRFPSDCVLGIASSKKQPQRA